MRTQRKFFMLLVMLFCGMTAAWGAQQVMVTTPVNGQVTISPENPTAGSTVTITVKPNQGFCIHKAGIEVVKLIDTGSAQGPRRIGIADPLEISGDEPTDPTLETSYTFEMPEEPFNVRVTATFEEAPSYAIHVNEAQNGHVQADKEEAKKGEIVALNVLPAPNYVLDEIKVESNGVELELTPDHTFVMPNTDVYVTATFKPMPLYVTGTFQGWDAAQAPEMTVGEGLVYTYEIGRVDGYVGDDQQQHDGAAFKILTAQSWQQDNYGSKTGQPLTIGQTQEMAAGNAPNFIIEKNGTYTITVDWENKTVTLNGIADPDVYNVIIGQVENGTVSADPTSGIEGKEITLTLEPMNEEYVLSELKVMCGNDEVEVSEDHKFHMPAGDVTVTATFTAKTYAVLFNEMQNGNVTPSGDKTEFAKDEIVALNVLPAPNYVLDEIKVESNGVELELTPDHTFVMPNTDVYVTATFKPMPLYVTGTFQGWDAAQAPEMTVGEGLVYTYEIGRVDGYVGDDQQQHDGAAFKILTAQSWQQDNYGSETGQPLTIGQTQAMVAGNAPNFIIEKNGTYTITVDWENKTVTLNGKTATPLAQVLAGTDGTEYTIEESLGVVAILDNVAYVTDGTDYIALNYENNALTADQVLEGCTVTGTLANVATAPTLEVSSDVVLGSDEVDTSIKAIDMSESLVEQVKLSQVVSVSGTWDGNALRAYSTAPQGQSLIVLNPAAGWAKGSGYTCTVAISLAEAWEDASNGSPRRVKAGDDLDFQNLRASLISYEVPTGLEKLNIDMESVSNIKYVNLAGQVSDTPFQGVNIVMVKFLDGSTRAVKVIK